eukprot:gene7528-8963_t
MKSRDYDIFPKIAQIDTKLDMVYDSLSTMATREELAPLDTLSNKLDSLVNSLNAMASREDLDVLRKEVEEISQNASSTVQIVRAHEDQLKRFQEMVDTLKDRLQEMQTNLEEASAHVDATTLNLAVDSAVKSVMDATLASAVNSALDPATSSSFQAAVRSAVNDAIPSAVTSTVELAVNAAVRKEVDMILTDNTGEPDYALLSAGASVVEHSTLHHSQERQALHTVPGIWYGIQKLATNYLSFAPPVNPFAAERVLSPPKWLGETPGHCLALNGTSGFLVIKLRCPISIHSVTLEHIPKAMAYDITSAPRTGTISGWLQGSAAYSRNVSDYVHVTDFTYDLDAPPVQTFNSTKMSLAVDHIRLQ